MKYEVRLHGSLLIDAKSEEEARAEAKQAIIASPDLLAVHSPRARGERGDDLYEIARKFTLADAALRDIAQYPLPTYGETLSQIARSALKEINA